MMSDLSKPDLVAAAMTSPSNAAIPRRSPSIRRTSHIDMHVGVDDLALRGAARDLITEGTSSTVTAEARVLASVDPGGRLAELLVTPDAGHTDRLIGLPVAGGFRAGVQAAFAEDVAAGTALAQLLDDLPVATLISGYARLYSGDVPADAARDGMKSDICSGWRADGTMMTSVRAGRGVPVTLGPSAPSIAAERDLDLMGWHEIGALREGSMRRRRLVDVHPDDGAWIVKAMFRDTHVQSDGDESVLHEYELTATVDTETRTYLRCSAVPRVLPWVECPVAAASADRMVGQHIDATRDLVRREFRGTSTCTHLNDLLRSLGDIGALMTTLDAASAHRTVDRRG